MSLTRHTFEAFPAHRSVSSPAQMRSAGGELARLVRPGDVIAIEGPLGSGKTTFAQGLIGALAGESTVTSPTFTFWHRYPGVEHLDLYRVDDERELEELGLEEAFGPDVVTVIEWPQNAPQLAGRATWTVHIAGSGETPREIVVTRD